MPIVVVTTAIRAPIERCFDLARDVDVHVRSTAGTNERAVGGVTHGLMELGQEVTWEATHFGVRQRLTSRITAYDRPRSFRDSQVRGAFLRFDHDHLFWCLDGLTTMTDVFDYTSPMGWLGRAADRLFLERYMRRFLTERQKVIKSIAEEVNPSTFRQV
jgi:ligand-binding SRPBCC domain-containing protein